MKGLWSSHWKGAQKNYTGGCRVHIATIKRNILDTGKRKVKMRGGTVVELLCVKQTKIRKKMYSEYVGGGSFGSFSHEALGGDDLLKCEV